jgi:hypothetical protein
LEGNLEKKGSGGQVVIDPLAKFDRASHARDHLAGGARLVENQCRDPPDAKGAGQGRLFVHVHFDDMEPAFILLGKVAQERRQLAARAAPRGPEIHDYRETGGYHYRRKFVRADIGDKGGGVAHGEIGLGCSETSARAQRPPILNLPHFRHFPPDAACQFSTGVFIPRGFPKNLSRTWLKIVRLLKNCKNSKNNNCNISEVIHN